VGGVNGPALGQKLSQLSTARKTTMLKEEPACVTARVFPQPNCRNGELARGIYETAAREGWKIEELHTEEGRLDEVFRSITMPDTVQEDRK
ncbi:MAG: ABC transporter ATP-binding protein, partial [Verrucomicrobia bacterium]